MFGVKTTNAIRRRRWMAAGLVLVSGNGCVDGGGAVGDGATPNSFSIESFTPGPGAGFGADDRFDRINAGPFGGGDESPSSDVLSFGIGGEIVVSHFDGIPNNSGPDFVIFENPFLIGPTAEWVFAEPAQVSVSADGSVWYDFLCDPTTYPFPGCAGVRPVYANIETNDISPLDFTFAGGDVFDLSNAGVPTNNTISIRLIRIRDVGGRWGEAGTSGFDLDAIWTK